MPRPVKLDFKPLTLEETAKALGVPPARARKILAMVGVDFNGRPTGTMQPTMQPRKARSGRGIFPQVWFSQDEDHTAVVRLRRPQEPGDAESP
jgi:hypothetical protein